jgi:hypothetical protein
VRVVDLLGGSRSPVGWTVFFIEAGRDRLIDEACRWRTSLGKELVVSTHAPYPDCLDLLEPLEAPWTTELFIDCGRWTAYFNNDKNGGDPTAAGSYLARRLGVRCVVAMHSPLHGPGHGGTQLWLHGPEGRPPLMYVRTITAVATDGRWSWEVSGDVQPFEDPAKYEARRVRDRFTRPILIDYLGRLDIYVDDAGWFGEGVSVRQAVAWPTNPESRPEARSRLGILEAAE